MRSGTWPDTAVRTTTARATLGATVHDIDEVSLTSEMSSELPVLSGASVAVTSGTVAWPAQTVVAVTSPQPFVRGGSTWPPAPAVPVTVEVGDGMGQWFKQITGLVDTSSGNIDSPQIQSNLIDYVDRLSAPVWHDPLLVNMPPTFDGGDYRRVGLMGTYVTDLAARTAGFHATPRAGSNARLSVPCMGSLWPAIGTCLTASAASSSVIPPGFRATSWGLAATDVQAVWQATTSLADAVVTVVFDEVYTGSLTVGWVNSVGVGAFVRQYGADVIEMGALAPGQVPLGSFPRNGAKSCAIHVYSSPPGTLTVTLRMSDGREVAGTVTGAQYGAPVPEKLTVTAVGGHGALLVENSSYPNLWTALDHVPTAIIRTGTLHYLGAMPTLRGETALALLSSQARAECSSTWIDSQGRLQWRTRGVLEAAAVVATKTTDLSVDHLAWTDNLETVRENVSLKHRSYVLSAYNRPGIPLVEVETQTMSGGQTFETWLEPGADEDWILPDLTLTYLDGTTTPTSPTVGSYCGGVLTTVAAGDATQVWAHSGQLAVNITTINRVIKLTEEALTLPAGKVVETRVAESPVNLPRSLWGKSLPLIRGYGKVQWTDIVLTYATGAVAAIPSYEHECGWFIQNDGNRTALRDYLLANLHQPVPTVTSIDIDPDPRLELGDKITVTDPSRTGLEMDLVITGIRQSWGSGTPQMSLSGRITRLARPTTPTDPQPGWDDVLAGWMTGP